MIDKLIIRKEKMTDEIIEQVMYIDQKFYDEEFSFEYYKERYSSKNDIYCLYDKNNIVGYISMYGIEKSLYDDLKKGIYDSDYEFDTSLLNDESMYVYISSIIILEKYRKHGYGIKLLDKILTQRGKTYIAMAISNDGFNLLSKRMNLIKRVSDNVTIFELINR